MAGPKSIGAVSLAGSGPGIPVVPTRSPKPLPRVAPSSSSLAWDRVYNRGNKAWEYRRESAGDQARPRRRLSTDELSRFLEHRITNRPGRCTKPFLQRHIAG